MKNDDETSNREPNTTFSQKLGAEIPGLNALENSNKNVKCYIGTGMNWMTQAFTIMTLF